MKRLIYFLTISIISLFLAANAGAVFNSGSTGADGPFNPPTQVPPGTVVDGNTVTVPLPSNGIFNFTTVNIASNITVKFTKNAINTPIYILATGDVTVAGTINISGADGLSGSQGAGGTGGYDGGFGGGANIAGGNGLGPAGGGGGPLTCEYYIGGGGGFGQAGGQTSGTCGAGGSVYGNARLQPLIGGSGGGGGGGYTGIAGGGGGGGGAILIASSGNITLTGSILSNGGSGYNPCGGYTGGGGSGGAIKLLTNTIYGNGTLTAKGGMLQCAQRGGYGRIRLEAYANNFSSGTDPAYSYSNSPSNVFVSNPPTLNITSIAGANVPSSPAGSYAQPDMMLPNTTTNPVTVNIAASYIPIGTQVTVSSIPQYGALNSNTAMLSGTEQSSTGSTTVNLSTQYSNVVTAQAIFVLQQAMFWDGEKIDKVRVAATMGKEAEVVYITQSGKEISYKELAGLIK